MTDQFASGLKINGCFIVQNISPQVKTINIFQYPINYLGQRDLLSIPGCSESDLRASLLKGELNFKIRAGDIRILCSDIDLLQYNSDQKAFLETAGVVDGMQISADQMLFLEQSDVQLVGNVDGTNTIFTIPSGVWIQTPPYKIVVYDNGVKQIFGSDYTIAQSVPGNGFDTVILAVAPTIVSGIPDVITADYYIDNSQS